jgi:hypothetical protein
MSTNHFLPPYSKSCSSHLYKLCILWCTQNIKHALAFPAAASSCLSSFHHASPSKQVHHSHKLHHFNLTLCAELTLICEALKDPSIPTTCPISHLIDCTPLGMVLSDSSLTSASGYFHDIKFWWYLKWSPAIISHTLKHIRNNNNRILIDNNVLEYSAIIINYSEHWPPSHCFTSIWQFF